jgi:hypothetical protein
MRYILYHTDYYHIWSKVGNLDKTRSDWRSDRYSSVLTIVRRL